METMKSFHLMKQLKISPLIKYLSPAMIDEKKLIYLNNYYINNSPEESIFNTLIELKGSDLKNLNITDEMILKFIALYKKRSSSILEINEKIFQIFDKKYNFTKIK